DGAAFVAAGTRLHRAGTVRSASRGSLAGGSARAEFEWSAAADRFSTSDGAVPEQRRRKERLGGTARRARAADKRDHRGRSLGEGTQGHAAARRIQRR